MFRGMEQMFTKNSEVVSLPSVVSNELVQSIEQKFERQHFTISEMSCEFPQISHTILDEVVRASLC
jgi:hypothetical protein